MSDARNRILGLKEQIKKWESDFFMKYKRKPSKDDVEDAADDIKFLYRSYSKMKKPNQLTQLKAQKSKEIDVWDASFNKSANDSHQVPSNISTSAHKQKHYDLLSSKLWSEFSNDFSCKFRSKKNGKTEINASVDPMGQNKQEATVAEGPFIEPNCNLKLNRNVAPSKIVPDTKFSVISCESNKVLSESKRKTVNSDWLSRCDPENEVSSMGTVSVDEPDSPTDKLEQRSTDFKMHRLSSPQPLKKINNTAFDEHFPPSDEINKAAEENCIEVSVNESNKSPTLHNSLELRVENDTLKNGYKDVFAFESRGEDLSPTLDRNESMSSSYDDRTSNELALNSNPPKKRKIISTTTRNELTSLTSGKGSTLEKKMKCGTQNDNYVRINLRRKKFSRQNNRFSSKAYKFQKWKRIKSKSQSESQSLSTCKKCGEVGHWAKFCPKERVTQLLPALQGECQTDDSPFPTLSEAAAMAQGIKNSPSVSKIFNHSCGTNSSPEDSVDDPGFPASNICASTEPVKPIEGVRPLCHIDKGNVLATPGYLFDALKKFGYSEFRSGQEATIMRILCGLSTLLVQSTGSGKSLCYQLPAYIYAQRMKCITLVISPLVSLMEDQVKGLPPCLKAACYHTNQTSNQRKSILESVQDGKVHVLLVSPEAIVGGGGSSGFLPSKIPPVAFACIDEVHCVSEWSHNFRPSYLRLCKVLSDVYGVKCFLGLTATATMTTIQSIAHHLNISDFDRALIKGSVVPDNLILSASRDYDRDEALLNLLKGERFSKCESVIIYCTRRQLTERLATMIRTCFHDAAEASYHVKKIRRTLSSAAEAYHAGLSAAKRKSVQNQFMSGKLRIVVATVAFGMGLDKPDVRAIIHYNVPKSFENYVQEIGRAGRDGLPAHCHVFLDSEGSDLNELRRHVFANSVDRHTVRKLIKRIFPENCHCESRSVCMKHEVAFPISQTVQNLDIKEESISTLLCYLELHPKEWIKVLNPVYATCRLKCYSQSQNLKHLAKQNPPVAAAIAIKIKDGHFQENSDEIEFSVVDVSSKMGWSSGVVKRELKNLEWNRQGVSGPRRSGVLVEFSNLALHVNAIGKLSDDEQDEILDFLYKRLQMQEKSELYQLKEIFNAVSSVSHAYYWACEDEANLEKSNKLKQILVKYFTQDSIDPKGRLDKLLFGQEVKIIESDCSNKDDEKEDEMVSQLKSDIRNFICTHRDHTFSGRAIARIFHGIASPCYPAEVWSKVRSSWRSYLNYDFNSLIQVANQELLKLR